MFRAVALRSDEGLTLQTPALENSLRWPIYNINPDNKTKLFWFIPFQRSTTNSMEINISFIYLSYVSRVPLLARFSVLSCETIMALLWGLKVYLKIISSLPLL